jgi:imidazole glycerol-phosphate synthase subunit HisH
MTTIAIVDHGAGNLVSIEQALRVAGATTVRVARPVDLEADGLVVPGVGSAGSAMARLRRQGLDGPVRTWALDGRPFLGICLGMQLLFETSDEDGSAMLGVLPGRVRRLAGAPRLPHMGWNQVRLRGRPALFAGIPDGSDFYFVHSFAAADAGPVVGVTEYGESFGSAVARDALGAVQFHPERSGHDGLRLLANFVAIAGRRA